MFGPLFDMCTGAMFIFSSARLLNMCKPREGWPTTIGILWKQASKPTELTGHGQCRLTRFHPFSLHSIFLFFLSRNKPNIRNNIDISSFPNGHNDPLLLNWFLFFIIIIIILSGFFFHTLTNHRSPGEQGGHFFNSSLPFPPTSRALRALVWQLLQGARPCRRTRTRNLYFLSTSREPPSYALVTSFSLLSKIIEVSHKGENIFFNFWALLKMLVVTFLLAQQFIQSTQFFSGSTYL